MEILRGRREEAAGRRFTGAASSKRLPAGRFSGQRLSCMPIVLESKTSVRIQGDQQQDESVAQRKAAFALVDEHPRHALHTVFQASQPSLFKEHTDLRLSGNGRRLEDPDYEGLIDVPVSVQFTGGNVVQALNAITRRFGGIWQAAYTSRGDNPHSLWVALYTIETDGGVTQLSSTIFTIPTGTPQ